MGSGAQPSHSALAIAQRLIAREFAGATRDDTQVAAALQRACVRVSNDLRDALGVEGCKALFARSLVRTEGEHPALKHIRRLDAPGIHLAELTSSVEAFGVAPVTAAIEALLATLVDILVRLIGEEMAKRLIDPDAPQSRAGDGAAP